MSQENVEKFRRGAEAVRSGDLDSVLGEVAEDVEWIAARSAVEGAYRGHAGLRRFIADTAESFEVYEPEWHELRDLGDRVLAIGTIRIRARGGGVDTELPAAGIATFRDGKLARWETSANVASPSKPPGYRTSSEVALWTRSGTSALHEGTGSLLQHLQSAARQERATSRTRVALLQPNRITRDTRPTSAP